MLQDSGMTPVPPEATPDAPAGSTAGPWWQEAVFYQIYPRSFADSSGDGTGDLGGVVERMGYLADLGIDALWLSPFYPSPQVDHGYDVADYCDVDPLFGTLADLDALVAAAHEHGIKVTIDLVPNHCSDAHPWFRAAVAAGRGSAERARFHFRDGRGPDGSQPPSNWRAVFGGSSWTRVTEPDGSPGQWYYHLFAAEQPDFNWDNPEVLAEFERVLRFWLDRGVDGFRIDVSDALIKNPAFPDTANGEPDIPKDDASGVHAIYRALRRVMDAYPGDRMAVIETGAADEVVALFLRPDEMHLAFNFRFLKAGFRTDLLHRAITSSLAANAQVGAPTTWVTDNHDSPRSVTRYAADAELAGDYVPGTITGGPEGELDLALGTARARAMALLLLALPGAAYVYNGQELGLPNVDDLPDEVLQDPIFARSGGTERGRDGCRIPIPWAGPLAPYGFSTEPETWLPMPSDWAGLTVQAQEDDPDSMLALYRRVLALRRREPSMRRGEVTWPALPPGADPRSLLLVGRRAAGGAELLVALNVGDEPVPLPAGRVLITSLNEPISDHLPANAAAILAVD
jgi:alpha-glucosidase